MRSPRRLRSEARDRGFAAFLWLCSFLAFACHGALYHQSREPGFLVAAITGSAISAVFAWLQFAESRHLFQLADERERSQRRRPRCTGRLPEN